jgi:hypothetical protein
MILPMSTTCDVSGTSIEEIPHTFGMIGQAVDETVIVFINGIFEFLETLRCIV